MNREPDQILDELLVIRAQAGERSAIGQLFERWQPRLLAHVRPMVNDYQSASDIVQETWMAIFKGLRRLRDPAAFRGWALQIAHRQAVNWIRRQSRERQQQQSLYADASTNPQTSNANQAQIDDELTGLQAAIQQLTPQQRALLQMFYHQQLPLADISKIVDAPIGTLKHRLFKLRKQLKSIIERKRNGSNTKQH